MANYTQLLEIISDNIKANGNQEITGPLLGGILQMMVATLGEGYQFMGIATPGTNPGTPDGNVFYIAIEPGTYSNFGVIVPNGSIGIISNTSGDWEITLINTYYEIDVDTLMQDSPSSEDIDEAIGSFSDLRRAIAAGVPFFGRSASGGNSTVAIAQVKQLRDTEVRVVMLNTGTVDGSNELVPIIKKITVSAGRLSLSTEAPTSFVGPLSSLNTNEKGSVVEAINEVSQAVENIEESLPAKQDKTDESLQTTDKTVTGAINEVNQAVKTKQDKLKAGTGVEITSDNTINVTLDTTVFKVVASLPESPAAGDENKIHLVPAESTEEGNIYTEYVFVNGKWEEFGTYRSEVDLTPYLKSTDAEATYQKITDNTLATTAKTIVGAINEVKSSVDVNSYKQYLHKVYEEYGAVYNDDTGYWELNGLTDLTEEDMWYIYLAGVPKTNDLTEFYANERSIRTTFNCRIKGGGTGGGAILKGIFIQCANLEVVQFYKSKGSIIYSRELFNAFYNCQKLREIGDILMVYISTAPTDNMFYNCKALESVKLGRLRTDISFKDSPLLSYESIKYLVDNAANTAAITVTVHPTTYGYLTGTTSPTAEVGGTTEEWQALVTTAQGKQISFAVPEEIQSEVTE